MEPKDLQTQEDIHDLTQKEELLPDTYWLADYIKPDKIRKSDFDNGRYSLAGSIYDALHDASIELASVDIEQAKRTADLALFFAHLTIKDMSTFQQRDLKDKIKGKYSPVPKEEIKITDEQKRDLLWIQQTFGTDLKLDLLPSGEKS